MEQQAGDPLCLEGVMGAVAQQLLHEEDTQDFAKVFALFYVQDLAQSESESI